MIMDLTIMISMKDMMLKLYNTKSTYEVKWYQSKFGLLFFLVIKINLKKVVDNTN